MELEVLEAFRAAGVPDDKARGVVVAINDRPPLCAARRPTRHPRRRRIRAR
jgi:hypothetical protein